MKIPATLFYLLAVFFPAALSGAELTVFIGTQTGGKDGSKGIYRSTLDLESGKLSDPVLAAEVANPGFLELHSSGKYLYATSRGSDGEGAVAAFSIDQDSHELTALNQVSSGGRGPCHASLDPGSATVFVANYSSGSVASMQVKDDGSLAEAASVVQHEGSSVNEKRQQGPHAHAVNTSPDGRFLYAADLGADKLFIYEHDFETGKITPADPAFAKLAPGAGPRHFSFRPDGRFVYCLNELASTITVFSWNQKTGALTETQTIGTLPEGFEDQNTTSEIRVHPTGNFVYAANRGHNSIAVFSVDRKTGALTFVEREPVGGKIPRNINLDPTGSFLIAANQISNNVPVFRVDTKTGELEATGHEIAVTRPMCIRFLEKRDWSEEGFVSLFDGETMNGWEGEEAWFRVGDGSIIAGNLNEKIPNNFFLASEKEFGDFELRFQAKYVGTSNAGVQFRSQRIPDDHEMIGYQCDIGNTRKGPVWGKIYDESRRRQFLTMGSEPVVEANVNKGDWNDITILAEGPRVRTWVNGMLTADYTEGDPDIVPKGRFGLQIHGGPPAECSYRNIRIKEL
ncbi:MAG: beta-propeller fold lactonase family protein [Verrucomicrobiota bacterium]